MECVPLKQSPPLGDAADLLIATDVREEIVRAIIESSTDGALLQLLSREA